MQPCEQEILYEKYVFFMFTWNKYGTLRYHAWHVEYMRFGMDFGGGIQV